MNTPFFTRILAGRAAFWTCGLALLCVACGTPLSNDRFEDDALFAAALPAAQDLEVTTPTDTARMAEARAQRGVDAEPSASSSLARTCADVSSSTCNPDAYRQQSVEVAQNMNTFVADLLGILDRIRSKPPSERTETTRVWGPAPTDETQTSFYRLSISWDDPSFTYYLFMGKSASYQGDVVMHGWFSPGSTAREGMGEFTFNLAVRYSYLQRGSDSGSVFVTYDTRGTRLAIELHGYELKPPDHAVPIEDYYAFRSDGAGSGHFYFDRPKDLDDPEALDRLSLWSVWTPEGGRSDLWVYTMEPDAPYNKGTECWNADLQPTYFYGACDQGVTWSDIGACPASVVGWEDQLFTSSQATE